MSDASFRFERIKAVLDRFKLSEESVIPFKHVHRQVEDAQNGLKETTTIPVNKSFKYDDVMREQREIIYAERYDVIPANRLAPAIKAVIQTDHQTDC